MERLDALISDPTCDPVALSSALDSRFGDAWLDWLPETLSDSYGVTASGNNHDKVLAIQVARTNPDCTEDWTVFVPVVTAFNNRKPDFENLEPPTTAELAYGCVKLAKIAKAWPVTGSARRYIEVSAIDDGLLVFPWADINMAEDAALRGMCAQDADSKDLARRVLDAFNKISGAPDVNHDADDAFEVMLTRLLDIRSYIERPTA
jgi:hypothetical protein